MDANDNIIPMVEDQGDPIPDELASQIQAKQQEQTTAEEMLANLEEDKEPLPWLPERGTTFTLEFEQGEREYKVTYINEGKYRFSCEPVDKGYLK